MRSLTITICCLLIPNINPPGPGGGGPKPGPPPHVTRQPPGGGGVPKVCTVERVCVDDGFDEVCTDTLTCE